MNIFWRLVAWIVTRECVKWRLIRYAMRTPYVHIMSADDTEAYMLRYWVFNPFVDDANKVGRWKRLPNIRVHHIRRPDADRHLHNHPHPKSRTIILDGFYVEETGEMGRMDVHLIGNINELLHDTFHRIHSVSHGGVWTLFFTWGVGQDWGFQMDDGEFVPHKQYLNER